MYPYETTYGSLLNISAAEAALTKYINTANLEELEFEYPSSDDTRVIFITGYSDEERDLPVWEHPMVLKTLKGNIVVATDIRKYVKLGKEEDIPARLSDIVKDTNSAEFVIIRALITRDYAIGVQGKHREVIRSATIAMGAWIVGMVGTSVSLDPVEMYNVEIMAAMYANTLLYDQKDVASNLPTIIARVMNSKQVYKINKKNIKETCDLYKVNDENKLGELIANIHQVIAEEKRQFITTDTLIGVMGNVWYGPGGSETPIMALEDMGTWLTLLYSVITNRSYAKSRIGTLLNRYSRVIDAKSVEKHFSNYLKEVRV